MPEPSSTQVPDSVVALGDIAVEERKAALECPFAMGKILGYDYSDPADFQRAMAQAMKDDVDFLTLAPRGHGKTTLNDVVGSVWEWSRDPDTRILLCHGVLSKAELIMKEATDHTVHNLMYRALFPEHCPQIKADQPGVTKWTTPARVRMHKEPTIMAAGPGSSVTGLHFKRIKFTDLVNEQNVPSPIGKGTHEAMEKVTNLFATFEPLLDATDPSACRQGDGTRWFLGDLYGKILEGEGWRCIVETLAMDEFGDPLQLWSLIPVERLIKARDGVTMTRHLWAANYLNDPISSDVTLFREEWFKFYEIEQGNAVVGKGPNKRVIPLDTMRRAVTIDPASGMKTLNDNTSMIATGICPQGDLFVFSDRTGHYSPNQFMEELFALDAAWNPSYVGIESVSFQKLLIWIADDIARREGRRLPLRELKADTDKVRRANILRLHAERYGIYVLAQHDELVRELCNFPAGRYDDRVDALAYRGQDLVVPGLKVMPRLEEPTFLNCDQYRVTGKMVVDAMEAKVDERNSLRLGRRRYA